ncbi:MAG: phage terminase large subunit family protein, partial [Pontibacterium sp.]
MDACKNPRYQKIIVKSASQMGKSELLLNIIGYYSHTDPSPMLLIQPTVEMAEAFSKDRLAPMIRDTKVLNTVFSSAKSRSSNNTILHKTFAGGQITMIGSNSPSNLAMRPIRILLADEINRYPDSAGTEGNPVQLA